MPPPENKIPVVLRSTLMLFCCVTAQELGLVHKGWVRGRGKPQVQPIDSTTHTESDISSAVLQREFALFVVSRIRVWGVVLVVCAYVGVGCVVLCRCVCM